MTSCPYRLTIALQQRRWVIRDSSHRHIHESYTAEAFVQHRGNTIRKHKSDIISLYNSRFHPCQILEKIRRESSSDISFYSKDISNLLQLHAREELQGQTRMEFLYSQLADDSFYICRDQRDPENRLISLLIIPQVGLELFK